MKKSASDEVQPELFPCEPLSDAMWESLDNVMLGINNDDAFLAAKIDGYIAGVLCCPVKLRSSEWFPLIWGSGQTQDTLGDMRIQVVVGLVMRHYNYVKSCLEDPGSFYEPRFDIDDFGEPMWDVWAEGFNEAIEVGHRGWDKISEKSLESELATESFTMLMGLLDIADGGDMVPQEDQQALMDSAPELIPVLTKAIYELNTRGKISLPDISDEDFENLIPKVGRNDPCPCGSGKKFKKCHGG